MTTASRRRGERSRPALEDHEEVGRPRPARYSTSPAATRAPGRSSRSPSARRRKAPERQELLGLPECSSPEPSSAARSSTLARVACPARCLQSNSRRPSERSARPSQGGPERRLPRRHRSVERARSACSAGCATPRTAPSPSTPRASAGAVSELLAFLRDGPARRAVAERSIEESAPRATSSSRSAASAPGVVRRAGARRHRPPLRPAPGGRRRHALLGGAEGPVAGSRGQAPGRAGRGSRLDHNGFEGALERAA